MPLGFKLWLSEKQSDYEYKSKLDLAKELILEYKDLVDFKGALLDGLYSSEEMMSFFEKQNIIYYMRLPKNRKVKHNPHAIAFKVGDSRYFKLKKNNRLGTFKAYFGDILRYITAMKRIKHSGNYETMYIVSNDFNDPASVKLIYRIRWRIEVFFRTVKQTLGIAQCKARSIKKQSLHIFSCFASYAILDSIKVYKKFDCTEDASRYLKSVKDDLLMFA